VDRRNLGLSLVAIGDLSRAKDLLERSLDESKKLFLTYNIAYCHFGLGDIAIREGRLSDSDNHFRQALALAQKGMMPDMEWRAFGAIGRVAQIQGRNKDAIVAFRQALEKLEEREGGLRSEASRNAFQSDAGTQEIYAHFAKVLMDEGDIAEAWQVAEQARSRAYIDAIGTRSVELARQRSRELKDRERSARLEMEQRLLANRISPDNIDLRAQAESSTKRYSSLLTEIESADFQLLDLLRVRKVSLSVFIKEVPDGVAVLSYLVTPSHLLIWSLSGGEIRGTQVALAADKLEKLTKEYRGLFENLSSTEFVGKELAEALINPVSDSLTKASHIVLIPHRSLHFVPFAALPVGTGYLTDIAPISYVESARVASYLLSRRDRVRVGRDRKIIALIDPKRSNPSIPRLPYTEKEVDAMKRFFSNVTRLDGEKASEDVLRRGTKDYQVLHIGSHGEFRSDQPTASRLLLSETETSDGNLDVVDILGLPEQADHVTLSACESGRGYVGSGDDVVSLDRAFFYAGAKTVVSSLWRISDVTSAVVMKRYYRYLSEGDSPSKAMQKAQLVVRKYFQHPAYWASFRVIGDGL
jgi:CHAT domain-containing protein